MLSFEQRSARRRNAYVTIVCLRQHSFGYEILTESYQGKQPGSRPFFLDSASRQHSNLTAGHESNGCPHPRTTESRFPGTPMFLGTHG